MTTLTIKNIITRLTEAPTPPTTSTPLTGDEPILVKFMGDAYPPAGFVSYRGYYDELAIIPNMDKDAQTVTVSAFVQDLTNIIGTELVGWKGGEFVMNPSTPVWVDSMGEVNNQSVVDVQLIHGIVTLITKDNDEW